MYNKLDVFNADKTGQVFNMVTKLNLTFEVDKCHGEIKTELPLF